MRLSLTRPIWRVGPVLSLSFVVSTVFTGLSSAVPFSFPFLERSLHLDSITVHQDFMVVFSFLSLATPVLLWSLLRGYREVISPRSVEKGSQQKKSLRVLLKFSGINGLIGLGAGFIIPLIPTWFFLRFGTTDAYSGPLLAVSNITIGLSATGSSRLARIYGQVQSIVMTTGLSTVFMLSLAFVPNAPLAASPYIVRAALMNMASPFIDSDLIGIIAPDV